MSDFEEIKRRLNLKDLVARECAGKVDKIGAIWRFNPCPFCGHKDCFTVGEKGRNLFNCYSCGCHGDPIDFIQQLKGISNIESLRYLGGGRHDMEWKDGSRRIPETMQSGHVPPPGESAPARTALSEEKRAEHCALRRLAAVFYHDAMMNDKDALAYQIEVRKHCRPVLERALVGCATKSLILHCRGVGIDPLKMVEVGLIQKKGNSLRDYIVRGMFIYPHFSGDEILFFSLKDPMGKFRYQIPKRRESTYTGEVNYFPDPRWICYGQDALTENGCWIVEGENDRLSLLDAEEPHVAATIGNYCTPEVTAWLSKNAGGKLYYLAFDNDDAGKKYTERYAGIILDAGGKAKKIIL